VNVKIYIYNLQCRPLSYWRLLVSIFKQNSNKFPEHYCRCVITDDWLEVCQCRTVGIITIYLSLSDPFMTTAISHYRQSLLNATESGK